MSRPDGSERRWSTFVGQFPVLVLARTFTSTVRAIEALDVLRGDFRLEFRFCFDESSAFHQGVAELLDRLGIPLVTWDDAIASKYALVITASENVDLTPFAAPVVVLPHGVGFQKYVPDSRSGERRLSGVVRPESREADGIHLALSHPDQRTQLAAAEHGRLAENTAVIGDLAYDRMRAGMRLRERYRSALGVPPGQRLVVLASTWGEQSAIGVHPRLPAQLLADLPVDGYRVAAVLHPNVWSRYGPWQVRHWLAAAMDAGLLLLPPSAGWGSALVAADCVVGDHSSMAVYAAALDRPLLLAAFGAEAVPGTAVARLGAQAPRLDPGTDLHPQVDGVIAEHAPGRYSEVADRAFAHVGESARRFAELCYGLLDLSAPDHCARIRALDPPAPDHHRPPLAFEMRSRLGAGGVVHVARYPASVRPFDEEAAGLRHLFAADTEPDQRYVENASVIHRATEHTGGTSSQPDDERPSAAAGDEGAPCAAGDERAFPVTEGEGAPSTAEGASSAADAQSAPAATDDGGAWGPDAERGLRALLELHPGALIAAIGTDGDCRCLLRDGTRVHVRSPGTAAPVLTAVVYTLLRHRLPISGDHRVRVSGTPGHRTVRIDVPRLQGRSRSAGQPQIARRDGPQPEG
ncbi:hypothetical protein CLV63_114141 [Murinocardiopsis flavida]|uniref:CDP-glycerol:poly(Glycerophosphate) glycerophosphotransferase n=1 Tax=Murinocardiopsis flavida TaxID=645275 RepID=A0A2P8DET5_9ACTN|nr:hypothetical protein [Murinocardiopsis flavida]PSK95708.1 hypothetical protein CLV63_114141 [Murinocardiopsis flavida]